MKWINILGDRELTLESIKRMKHTGTVRTYDVSSDCIYAEYADGHIFFDLDTDLSDWQEELDKLPFHAEAVITIRYRNAENVRQALLQPDFPENVYVDNDLGVLLPLREYIAAGMPMEE